MYKVHIPPAVLGSSNFNPKKGLNDENSSLVSKLLNALSFPGAQEIN